LLPPPLPLPPQVWVEDDGVEVAAAAATDAATADGVDEAADVAAAALLTPDSAAWPE